MRCLLFTIASLCFFLSGCSGDAIVRGKLEQDWRAPLSRKQVNWPKPPDEPRFRYIGELVGEPNFVDISGENKSTLTRTAITIGKWIAGLLTVNEKLVLMRPMHGYSDESGRIYVVDAGRSAIMAFEPQAMERKTGEGQMLLWTHAEDHTAFQSPICITGAWNETLAITDAKLKAVYLLNKKGEFVDKIGAKQLGRPTGVAFDNTQGHLYVADTESSEIKVFNKTGDLLKIIGKAGDGQGELNAPTHIAFSGGLLHVSDSLNNRIQVFDTDGRHVRTIGEAGVYVGQFSRPKGVAFDPEQKLTYVIESYFAHLLIYDEEGRFLMGIDGSGLPDGRFALPAGIWTDGGARIYVADMYNNRIVIFDKLPPRDN